MAKLLSSKFFIGFLLVVFILALVALGRESYRYFRVSQDNPAFSLTEVGHDVEITAFDLRVDEVNDVVSFINLMLPTLKTSP